MMLRAYSIFDRKALTYHAPFFAHTNGSAVRSLSDIANDPNTAIGRHPSDYVLYCVADYDDQTAVLTPLRPLEHVVDAIGLVRELLPPPSLPFDLEKRQGDSPSAQHTNGRL